MKKWLLICLSSTCFGASYAPWFAGPIIGTSANNVPAGCAFVNPILVSGDFYGLYNNHWSLHHTGNLYQLNYSLFLQFGILRDIVDCEIFPQGFSSFFHGKQSTSWGDLPIGFGVNLLREKAWCPQVRLLLDVIIPTGKYNHLEDSLKGIDGVGRGSWTFAPLLAVSKIVGMNSSHPVRLNLNLSYSLGTTVTVRGRSVYGGSHETVGAVKPGHQIFSDFSIECSLSQRWDFVLETIYTHNFKSPFSGKSGGSTVGLPSSDVFSIAPELEFNITKNYGWAGGIWFSMAGRNLPSFVNLLLSTYVYF